MHVAVLKGKVAAFHRAVDESEVFAVAERLGALDVAAHEGEPLGIPAEILPVDDAVLRARPFRVPEGILGVEDAVFEAHALCVLEGIFAVKFDAVQMHAVRTEERVFRRHLPARERDVPAVPAELGGIDIAVAQRDVFTLPHRLDTVQLAALDRDIPIVPERGAAVLRHFAVAKVQPLDVPEGIAKVEEAVLCRQIFALFEGRFAVLLPFETAVSDECAPRHIERAFLPEALVFVPCQFLCMFHSGNYITILTRCQSKSAVFFSLIVPLETMLKA